MNTLVKNRLAISSIFFISGICFASCASRIPDIKAILTLSEGELGALLLGMPVGALVAMPFSGWLVDKFNIRTVIIIAAMLYPAVLPLIGLATSAWTLAMVLFLYGMSGNLLGISMNTQALGVQKLYGKTIIASFHGMWSLAGFTGGAIGALMINFELATLTHFLIIASISFLIIAIASRYTIAEKKREKKQRSSFP